MGAFLTSPYGEVIFSTDGYAANANDNKKN